MTNDTCKYSHHENVVATGQKQIKFVLENLIKNGLMQSAGMEKVNADKKDGSWTFLDDIEDLVIPEDLNDHQNKTQQLKQTLKLSAIHPKKQILYWIVSAKRQDTRLRRIKKTVELASENKKP